jgi:hypothetical protein
MYDALETFHQVQICEVNTVKMVKVSESLPFGFQGLK